MACCSSLFKGSDETFSQYCEVCKFQNVTSDTMSYCIICDSFLCMACEKVHRGSILTRNHTLLTEKLLPTMTKTSISTSPTVFCEDHKTMIVSMYCPVHDDVICITCKISSHRYCNTTGINQQAQQMKKDGSFKDVITRLEDLKSRYDQLKEMRNADKGVRRGQVKSESLVGKCQVRKDINRALDPIENTLSNEIHKVNERNNKDIENHIAMLDEALTQISYHVKSLKECEIAGDDDAMFVVMNKATNVTSRYEDIISKMEDEFDRSEKTYKINGDLNGMVRHLRSIDTVLTENRRFSLTTNKGTANGQRTSVGFSYSRHIRKYLMKLSVSGKRGIAVGYKCVFGCTFMPDGHLVLCCGTDGIILLDTNFRAKFRLDVSAYDVAVINHNEIVIINVGEKQIQKVKLFPLMKVSETIRVDRECCGVDVSCDEIYVTCHDFPGNGEVQVLDMNGKLQRRLGVNNGKYMFKRPDYVTVNKDGSRVFISDWVTDSVTCLDKQGHVIYKYTHKSLKTPLGMYVNREGYLLVCGNASNNVHVIGQYGRKEIILLSKTDGIESPWCTVFRQRDGCLIVGTSGLTTQSLSSFTLN